MIPTKDWEIEGKELDFGGKDVIIVNEITNTTMRFTRETIVQRIAELQQQMDDFNKLLIDMDAYISS